MKGSQKKNVREDVRKCGVNGKLVMDMRRAKIRESENLLVWDKSRD